MPSLAERLTAVFTSLGQDNARALEGIDALYADHMRFVDPIQQVEGRAAFRRLNERLLERSAEIRFEGFAIVGDEPLLVATWVMIWKPKVGPQMRIPGASEMRTEGGRVVYQRDYWDLLSAVMSGFPLVEPIYKRMTALLG
jgi:hypothetical protein